MTLSLTLLYRKRKKKKWKVYISAEKLFCYPCVQHGGNVFLLGCGFFVWFVELFIFCVFCDFFDLLAETVSGWCVCRDGRNVFLLDLQVPACVYVLNKDKWCYAAFVGLKSFSVNLCSRLAEKLFSSTVCMLFLFWVCVFLLCCRARSLFSLHFLLCNFFCIFVCSLEFEWKSFSGVVISVFPLRVLFVWQKNFSGILCAGLAENFFSCFVYLFLQFNALNRPFRAYISMLNLVCFFYFLLRFGWKIVCFFSAFRLK